ncbi:MAG TPA: urea ABC transporter permease subunit UrtC [Kiritimatiellia bacterium]|nr:urea ABC transporter permease subunit UrtC [Kiritimatiellia bacterium]HMP34491.1 urea ABC transporter permease subunit UrtC [Kiritimatiellia bacterium]
MSNAPGFAARLHAHRFTLFLVAAGLFAVPAAYLAGHLTIETVNMLGRYLTFAIVAIGLDLIWGYTGILSLCQALFFSLGGYAMGMYLAHHGGPEGIIDANGWKIPACLYVVYPYAVGEAPGDATVPWFWKPFFWLPLTVALGVLIPGLVAYLIGYFGFKSKVRGVYFSILTQAITVAFWLVFCMNNMKLCGTNGLTRFATIAGFPLTSDHVKLGLYLTTVVLLIASYLLCRWLTRSPFGRVLVAVRDDEKTLRFSGYRPYHYKAFVFTVAGALAGLGGMLYAPQMGIFTPANMAADRSILVVIWVAVGGRGTLSGAVIGALGVNLFYSFLTTRAPEVWPFVQGLLFLAVVLLMPGGVMGLGAQLAAAWTSLRARWTEPAPASLAVPGEDQA